MNEGMPLDLDTWIVPGQIRKANLCRGLGNRYIPAGTKVLISYHIYYLYMFTTMQKQTQQQAVLLLLGR